MNHFANLSQNWPNNCAEANTAVTSHYFSYALLQRDIHAMASVGGSAPPLWMDGYYCWSDHDGLGPYDRLAVTFLAVIL